MELLPTRTELQDLLREPQETPTIEIKGWINPNDDSDRANIAKACIALANSDGGHILIGLHLQDGHYLEAPGRPDDLGAFDTDWVNSLIARYAEPPFHADVSLVEPPGEEVEFPIVSVYGGSTVPIQAKRSGPHGQTISRGTYYIRRPGPASQGPQSAEEWRQLIDRCLFNGREELLDRLRRVFAGMPVAGEVVEGTEQDDPLYEWKEGAVARWSEVVSNLPDGHPARCQQGYWTCTYRLVGAPTFETRGQLLEAVRNAKVRHTGWPAWWAPTREDIEPYPIEDGVECWLARDGEVMHDDPGHADFWRASTDCKLFLLRGYNEDAPENGGPGELFDLTVPVWRIGDCLLHAHNLARLVEPDRADSEVEVLLEMGGLRGRRLTHLAGTRRLIHRYEAQQNFVRSRLRVPAGDIPDALPELVRQLLADVFEAFSFFQPPRDMYAEELARMRRNQF